MLKDFRVQASAAIAAVVLIVGFATPSSLVTAAVADPGPPAVVAQSGAAAVAVYLAPGSPAQTIEVTASDGQTCSYESTADDSFCTISGLDNGSEYTFTATTTIGGETSPSSIATSATPTIVSEFITEDLIPTTSDALEYTYGLTLVDSTNTYRYAIGGQRGLTGKFRNSDGELIDTGVVGGQYSGPRSGAMLTDSMFVIGTDQNADVKSVDADTLDVLDTLDNLQYGIADIIKDPASDDHVYVIGNAGRTYGYSDPVIRYVEVAGDGSLTIEATTALTSAYSNRVIRAATLVDPSATAGDEYFVVAVSGANTDGDYTTFEPDEVVLVPLASLTADSTTDSEDTGDLALSGLTKLEASAANTSDVALYIEALVEHNGVIYFGGRGGVDPWPPRIGRVAADLSGFSSVMEGTPSVVGTFGDLLVGYNSSYALLDNEVALYDTTTTPMTLVGGATREDLGNIAGLTVLSDGTAYSTGDDYGGGINGYYFWARVMDLDAPLSITRPDSPEISSFSGSSSSINVYWNGSEDDGGFPIRGYLVEMAIGDGDFEVVDDCADELADSEASWCQIGSGSITPGEDHQVRVSAVTAAGLSTPAYSATVNISESGGGGGGGEYTEPDPVSPAPTFSVGQSNGALVVCVAMNDSPATFLSTSVFPTDFQFGQSSNGDLLPSTNVQRTITGIADAADAYPRAEDWDGADVAIIIPQQRMLVYNDDWEADEVYEVQDWEVGTEYRVSLFASQVETSFMDPPIAQSMLDPVLYTFAATDTDCGVEPDGGSGGSTPATTTTAPATTTTAPATTTTAPATTTTAPATTTTAAPTNVPTLVTSSNQELLTASAGSAKILINGELVEVELVQASEELRRTVAGARTFEQVRALQTLAAEMVSAIQAVLGDGATLPITVTNTSTGATISGLVSDPVTGAPLPIPVEDVLLILNENLVLMVGGADGTNNPANIAFDGVLEFGEGGYVAVLAYGLTPGAAGEVVVMSTPQLLDTFTVGTDGGVAAQAAIPADLAPGEHTVVVAVDGKSASLGFRVLSAVTLPVTGGSSSLPSALAVLLAAVGAFGVLVVSRRRHTA